MYRTDEDGTIIATSDGEKITFNVPASNTWKAGEPTKSSGETTVDSAKTETGAVSEKEQTKSEEPTANRKDTSESRDSIIAQGYVPCKRCNP